MSVEQSPPAEPDGPLSGERQLEDASPEESTGGVGWRRVCTGALIAGGLFFALSLLAWSIPFLAVLAGAVFLPVALWVGRGSRRPWLDGLVYGLFSAVLATIALLVSGFPLPGWAPALALLLAIPQGVLGTWLGARFLPPPRESA